MRTLPVIVLSWLISFLPSFGQPRLSQFIISGGQICLLILLFQFDHPTWRTFWLSTMAALSLLGWTLALRRRRAITDCPVSPIASAAQGYVSLHGRGKPHDPPLRSQVFQRPCVWYRFETERRESNNRWEHVASGESELDFLMDDGSGECVVSCDGAEIETTHRETREHSNYRTTEWTLRIDDEIYLLGYLRTRNHTAELDTREDMKILLEEWKQDPDTLLRRFDLDKNGEIDMQEWALVRRAARREIEKQHREARELADTHLVGRPPDGRLYLITNRDPSRLARRYLLWMIFHLIVFFGSLIGIAAVPHFT